MSRPLGGGCDAGAAGIFKLSLKRRLDSGYLNYAFRVKAYGDLRRANLPRMTTQIYVGDDVAYLTAVWSGEPGRWKLQVKDANNEQ